MKNQVLSSSYRPVSNFFEADVLLRDYLERRISAQAYAYMSDKWQTLGQVAAQEMDELSLLADKHGPVLQKRDWLGRDVDKIVFHPAYQRLLQIAVDSEMFRVKWEPELSRRFGGETHRLGFVSGYLFALAELGLYCPLCMTDGLARVIDRHASAQDRERILPRIYTQKAEELATGAMFLTEKAGGSDVGQNLVEAHHLKDDVYLLTGEKWFCSNANAPLILALARTDAQVLGTKGLSIFLLEQDGSWRLPIVRLKDKLGVRSMASAECILDQSPARLLGQPFEGFKIMTEMINLSRLYNALAALSAARRALVEAYTFAEHRYTFGQKLLEQALIRDKFYELTALYWADFYLCWTAIETLDAADAGDEAQAQRLRLLTPMTKRWTAEKGVYLCREAMELMGGLGYIEDGPMPKIMRDVMVLPIWEGAGNIMILDMLRASFRGQGLSLILEDLAKGLEENPFWAEKLGRFLGQIKFEAASILAVNPPSPQSEQQAKYFFETLTTLYQIHCLICNRHENNAKAIDLSLDYLYEVRLLGQRPSKLPSLSEIRELMAWKLQA